jgi:hypothetical protein
MARTESLYREAKNCERNPRLVGSHDQILSILDPLTCIGWLEGLFNPNLPSHAPPPPPISPPLHLLALPCQIVDMDRHLFHHNYNVFEEMPARYNFALSPCVRACARVCQIRSYYFLFSFAVM